MKKTFSIFNGGIWLLLMTALLSASSSSAQVISTYAGNRYGDGLNADFARLGLIWSMAIDPSGNMYLADADNHRVRKVNSSRIMNTYAGSTSGYSGDGSLAINAQLGTPSAIAADNSGNLYIGDLDNYNIRKVDASGIITNFAGNGVPGFDGDGGPATSASLASPYSIATDAAGNVYLAYSGRIRKVSSSGIITTFAGTGTIGYSGDGGPATAATIAYTRTIFTDGSGNVFLAGDDHRVRKITPSGIISTIAGTGVAGTSGDGGPATAATLENIAGGAADAAGNIYLADYGNSIVRKISTSGIITRFAGSGSYGAGGDGGAATAAAMVNPVSIAADAAGNVYIGCGNGTVRKVNTLGIISTEVGFYRATGFVYSGDGSAATTALGGVLGVAPDGRGNVYVSSQSNRVLKVASGMVTLIAGGGTTGYEDDGGPATSAEFSSLTNIAADSIGNVYVGDNNSFIRKIDTNGIITTIHVPEDNIEYVAVDKNGNLYSITWTTIYKKGVTGTWSVFAGNGTVGYSGDGGLATSAQLFGPQQINFDNDGNVYIADTYNNRIRKVDASGIITTIAGNGTYGNDGDGGPATSATIDAISVAVDKAGNIFIGGFAVIRKINTSGIISTYAGDASYGYEGYAGDGGPAADALISITSQMNFDKNGRLFIADWFNDVVRVIDDGVLPISGGGTLCVGGTLSLSDASSGGTWNSSDPTIATVGSSSGIVFGITLGTATITYTATVGGSSSYATTVVTVTNTVAAGTITGTAPICLGNELTLSNTTTGGTWSSSNTSVATIGTSGIVTGIGSGTTTITYTVTSGCGSATTTTVVTVNATPSAGTITGTATVCTGNTTTLSNATTGGVWSSSDITVATVGSASGVVSGITSGNATITYSVSGSCGSAIATKDVTVNGLPSAGTITGTAAVCTGNTTTLNNTTTGGTWNSSNAAVATVGATTGIVSGVAAGSATITYTVTNGCGSATATKVVTVSSTASAGTITGSATVCIGGTTTLNNATTGGTWNSSNTAVASVNPTTGIVTGITNGNATITYAVSGTCGTATATTVVTVGVTASITGTLALCSGMTSSLSAGSTGGVWSSSNTAVATIGAANGVLTAVSTGTSNITYTVSGGCTATAVVSVSMPAIIGGTSNACVGQTATLTDATAGGTWSSSNTALATVDATTGVVTGIAAGTATISYYVSAGCYRVISFTVKALPPAIATPIAVCEGSTLYVAPPSTNGQSWVSSNTSVAVIGSTSGMLTGVTAGTTTLTYNTNTGCFVTATATVVTTPSGISGTLSVCPGTTSTLSGTTTGGAWSGSNGAIATINSSTGVVTGIGAGTIIVSYTTTGCRITAIATVNPLPAVISGTATACVAQSSTLTNTTADGTWSSNHTGIATVDAATGEVTGVSAATTTVTYTLATGCYRTIPFTVKALPPAIATTAATCVGTGIIITPPGTNGKSWSSSNAAVATIGSSSGMMTGVATGTTTITFTTTTGCFVTTEATVYALPNVGTITGPTSVVVGNTITLDDAAGGGVWSSNAIAKATIGSANGIVTGVSGGAVTISYSVSNPGCTVRATKAITVATSRPGSMASSDNGIFSLYPNPTTGAFTVEADEPGTLNIYSLDGKEVSKHNITTGANQLSLAGDFASGIYMCRFTGESGNTTMVRLIFER